MRITWLTAGGIMPLNGKLYSPLASQRYRVLIPAQRLEDWGHPISLVPAQCPLDAPIWETALHADVVVVSKIFSSEALEIVRRARLAGAKIVLDLCDDHFETPELGPIYTQLCQTADAVAVSTSAMGENVALRFGRHSCVIDDPFEAPLGEPAFQPRPAEIQLAWFGSPANFDTCAAMLPILGNLSRCLPLTLQVVTDPLDGVVPSRLEELTAPYRPAMQTRFISWTPADAWTTISNADLVVVPSFDDRRKRVKGPNRVVESLRLGRFVVAYPLPSYGPLGQYAWLGQDLAAGIRWAVANPSGVLARLRAGQKYVAARFLPDVIARAWETMLHETLGGRAAQRTVLPAPSSRQSSVLA